jgi:hypothetical protein
MKKEAPTNKKTSGKGHVPKKKDNPVPKKARIGLKTSVSILGEFIDTEKESRLDPIEDDEIDDGDEWFYQDPR